MSDARSKVATAIGTLGDVVDGIGGYGPIVGAILRAISKAVAKHGADSVIKHLEELAAEALPTVDVEASARAGVEEAKARP